MPRARRDVPRRRCLRADGDPRRHGPAGAIPAVAGHPRLPFDGRTGGADRAASGRPHADVDPLRAAAAAGARRGMARHRPAALLRRNRAGRRSDVGVGRRQGELSLISVLVTASDEPKTLTRLLTALVPAAAEGLVREVAVIGAAGPALSIADDAGAELYDTFADALERAKGPWIAGLPLAATL